MRKSLSRLTLFLFIVLLLALTPRALAASPFPAYKAPPAPIITQRILSPGYALYAIYIVGLAYISTFTINARSRHRGLEPIEPVWGGLTAYSLAFIAAFLTLLPFLKLLIYIQLHVFKITRRLTDFYVACIVLYAIAPQAAVYFYRRRRNRREAMQESARPPATVINICPQCGKVSSPEATLCGSCGCALDPPKAPPSMESEKDAEEGEPFTRMEFVMLALIILLAVVLILLVRNRNSA